MGWGSVCKSLRLICTSLLLKVCVQEAHVLYASPCLRASAVAIELFIIRLNSLFVQQLCCL
jgi:hypothetical protein